MYRPFELGRAICPCDANMIWFGAAPPSSEVLVDSARFSCGCACPWRTPRAYALFWVSLKLPALVHVLVPGHAWSESTMKPLQNAAFSQYGDAV